MCAELMCFIILSQPMVGQNVLRGGFKPGDLITRLERVSMNLATFKRSTNQQRPKHWIGKVIF